MVGFLNSSTHTHTHTMRYCYGAGIFASNILETYATTTGIMQTLSILQGRSQSCNIMLVVPPQAARALITQHAITGVNQSIKKMAEQLSTLGHKTTSCGSALFIVKFVLPC